MGEPSTGLPAEYSDPAALQRRLLPERLAGKTIGLVPTMGFLHAGHGALVREARAENDVVVMSIFVNPTQFGPHEDFARYPRDLPRDRRLAGEMGVHLLFVPTEAGMYPAGAAGQRAWIDPGPAALLLDGASRPGHFRGVATVLAKLFHLVRPHRAYFGQKDGQQVAIVRAIVEDLAFPLQVRVVPTVREPDGLALSSRNVYLSPEERAQAVALARSLEAVRTAVADGERHVDTLEGIMRDTVRAVAPAARLDYASLVDPTTLAPLTGILRSPAIAALALYLGGTRLIDNEIIRPEEPGE